MVRNTAYFSYRDMQNLEAKLKVMEYLSAEATFQNMKNNKDMRQRANIKYYSTGEEDMDKLPQTVEELEQAIKVFPTRISDGGKGVPVMVSLFRNKLSYGYRRSFYLKQLWLPIKWAMQHSSSE